MGLKIALELILKYYLFNKTKILSILEAKILKRLIVLVKGVLVQQVENFKSVD